MNKKLITLLSILSLFLSIPLEPVNAAVKTGGTCSKVGVKSVASNNTYTCIKSGKKLVWDKGIANQKEAATNPLITVGDLTSSDSIIKAASDNFKNYTAKIRSSQEVKVVAQTGVDQQLITWVQEGANYVAQRFAYPKLTRSFVDVIAIDVQWLQEAYTKEGFSSDQVKDRVGGFNAGAPAFGGAYSNTWNYYVIQKNNSLVTNKSGMAQTSGHEYFHAVQENLAGFAPNRSGSNVPNWFWEGPAMFVGLQTTGALGFINYSTVGHDSMTERFKNDSLITRT